MAGMPAPQPDPKQQLDAAHAIAPPAANLTSAYAPAQVQGGLNRAGVPYMVPNPGIPSAVSVGPVNLGNAVNPDLWHDLAVTGAAAHSLFGNGVPVTAQRFVPPPTAAPTIVTHGPNFGQPAFAPPPPLPLSLPHAKAMFDNAIGATTAAPAPAPQGLTGPNAFAVDASGQHVPLAQNQAVVTRVGPAPHEIPGTPEHTITNAHNMSSDQFVNAMRGVPGARVMAIMDALKPPSMQEQAARLAVQTAAQNRDPGVLQRILINLGLGPNALYAQPAQGAVAPDGQ
jgi:hypothetical protein